MNNVDLKRNYKRNSYVSLFIDDDEIGTLFFKIDDLIDNFSDNNFIAFRGVGDDKDILINVNKIKRAYIHDEKIKEN